MYISNIEISVQISLELLTLLLLFLMDLNRSFSHWSPRLLFPLSMVQSIRAAN